MDECRRATVAHVALPPGESVRLEFVRDKPWGAFSRYLGGARSVIQINADFRFTIDQALQIACHEAYPGHHTRNTLIASSLADGRHPERAVQLMFSREALTSEATAMLAVDVAFPPAERVRVERERLFPLAGLHSGGVEQHVAVERLVSICRWCRPRWRAGISMAISSSRARSARSKSRRSCRTPRR